MNILHVIAYAWQFADSSYSVSLKLALTYVGPRTPTQYM